MKELYRSLGDGYYTADRITCDTGGYQKMQDKVTEIIRDQVERLREENSGFALLAKREQDLAFRFRTVLEDIVDGSSDIYAIRKARSALEGDGQHSNLPEV